MLNKIKNNTFFYNKKKLGSFLGDWELFKIYKLEKIKKKFDLNNI